MALADDSGKLNVSFWDAAVPLYYEHIQVNDIVRMQDVQVRQTNLHGIEGAVNVKRKTIFGNVPLDLPVAFLSQNEIELFLDSVSQFAGPVIDILRSPVQLAHWTHDEIMERFPYETPQCTDTQALQCGSTDVNGPINVCAKVVHVGNIVRFCDKATHISSAPSQLNCVRWANLDIESESLAIHRHDLLRSRLVNK